MKNLLTMLVVCLALSTANAQQCPGNIFLNPGTESGNPTTGHQDIDNADNFSRLWASGSLADYYNSVNAPSTWAPPTPPDGNYVGCWIANYNPTVTTYREGFQAELQYVLPPNTGSYTLTFETACLGGWGTANIGVYGIHNLGGGVGLQPTGSNIPSNNDLFGAANTVLLGSIPVTTCSNTKVGQSITINTNAANYPANGISHIMITHNGVQVSGARYMAFDNFCLSVNSACPAGWTLNGDLETGTPTASHQDIDNAANFSRIWTPGSWADYYTATVSPIGSPPTPATGNYASCWIANYNGGGTTYREGFQAELVATIAPNTGSYDLSFDMACLHAWGVSEVAVYGVTGSSGPAPNSPTGAFTPNNLGLFGAANTVLLGTIPLPAGSCSNVKVNQTITFNSAAVGFPAGGIGRFFVTHSDNNTINGAHYMTFDNFCLQTAQPAPCPELGDISVICDPDVPGNYILNINASGSGTITLNTSCGTLSPSSINVSGAATYSTLLTTNGTCSPYSISFTLEDPTGINCGQGSFNVTLPPCDEDCLCDESFFDAVNQGFNSFLNCPQDRHVPIALLECDRVDWFIDGNHVGTTMGNDPFTVNHTVGAYQICIVVTRTEPSGKTCEHRFCRNLEGDECDRRRSNFSEPMFGASPNPAQDHVTLTWSTDAIPENITITVVNASGAEVFRQIDVNGPVGNYMIDISDLANGLYFVRIQGLNYEPAPIKFVKE